MQDVVAPLIPIAAVVVVSIVALAALKERLNRLEHAQRLLDAALLLKVLAEYRELPEDEIAIKASASMTEAECIAALTRVTHLGLVTYREDLGTRYYRVVDREKYQDSKKVVN